MRLSRLEAAYTCIVSIVLNGGARSSKVAGDVYFTCFEGVVSVFMVSEIIDSSKMFEKSSMRSGSGLYEVERWWSVKHSKYKENRLYCP